MIKYLLILMMLLCYHAGKPCGNAYGHSIDGKFIPGEYIYLRPAHLKFNLEEIKKVIAELRTAIRFNPDNYKALSDLALCFMKTGKSDSAVIILRPLAIKHPKEYNIIANLGTAYELTGKLDSALKYIKRDLELNPDSHLGSEWIHVKILEAKIKSRNSPGWMNSHSILDLKELLSKIDTTKRADFMNFQREILYQIRTRAPFTPAPDKVISNLMLTLAELNKKVGSYENALLAYAFAMRFEAGYEKKYFIENQIKKLNRSRDSTGKFPGVDDFFLHFIKESELNTNLMMLGLDSLADHLANKEDLASLQSDSIKAMQKQLDSLQKKSKTEKVEMKSEEKESSNSSMIIFLLGGLIIGSAITWLLLKLKRKSP